MSTATRDEPQSLLALPDGVRRADERPKGLVRIPDVPVRGHGQAPDEMPLLARPRFAWNARELSGALGDLGTFLPHVIGAITVVGMDPVGVLTAFGVFYVATGAFYGVPIAVQPMKAASAAALVEPMSVGAIAGAGMVIGLFFLVAGATGIVSRIARAVPPAVASGLQLGLGVALGALGTRMIAGQAWLGVAVCVVMLVAMRYPRMPAALVALLAGTAAGQLLGMAPPPPTLTFGLHLPPLVVPSLAEVLHGIEYAVLPQVPLTLTNAIIVTAVLSRQLFPHEVTRASERNLALTTGFGNLLAAPFGGYLMCHGAGGLSGHYRFGARTATAPVLIGLAFVILGLFFGASGYALLKTIPDAVLGALLLFSGIELALSSKPQQYRDTELFLVLLMAAIAVALNPAVAFAVGLPLALALRRGWLKL